MLRVIDQHWRTHLYEMDYLKEGIHLRAAGQKDPLSEWQREGFEMFGDLMQRIRRDFVRMITHIQVVKPETEQVSATRNVTYSGPTDPSEAPSALAQAAAAAAGVPLAGAKPAAAPSRRRQARCGGHRHAGAQRGGEDRPQRALPVRLGQEVQALLRSLSDRRSPPVRCAAIPDPPARRPVPPARP